MLHLYHQQNKKTMTTTTTSSDQLSGIVSNLNHKVTGSLARLEGLYRLYQQEGSFRDELWEQAFEDAKHQLKEVLGQSFSLCAAPAEASQTILS